MRRHGGGLLLDLHLPPGCHQVQDTGHITQLCSMWLYGVLFMLYDLKFDLPQRSLGLPFEAKQDISTYILHESDACCILLLLCGVCTYIGFMLSYH